MQDGITILESCLIVYCKAKHRLTMCPGNSTSMYLPTNWKQNKCPSVGECHSHTMSYKPAMKL